MRDPTTRPLWGWTVPARWLLSLAATAGALGLLAIAPSGETAPVPAPRLIVDPNEAPAPVLSALPKLGPALVGRIIEAREERPFRSLDDLDLRVRGIGPATIAALRPYLRIDHRREAAPRASRTSPDLAP